MYLVRLEWYSFIHPIKFTHLNIFQCLDYEEASDFYSIEKALSGAKIWLVKVGHCVQKMTQRQQKQEKLRFYWIFM